jgi:hypothetical protein
MALFREEMPSEWAFDSPHNFQHQDLKMHQQLSGWQRCAPSRLAGRQGPAGLFFHSNTQFNT